jgi:hypothetical protein
MPLAHECELAHWTSCGCHYLGLRKTRNWHELMGYTDSAGRPLKHLYHTYHERLVTQQSIRNEEGDPDDDYYIRYPFVEYTADGKQKEFTVELRRNVSRSDSDQHVRPCDSCIGEVLQRGIRANIRLPPTASQPPLIEELAEFHMATVYNAGDKITFDDALEYVKTKHPRGIRHMQDLSHSTDVTVDALSARIERLERELAAAEKKLHVLRYG